MKLECPSDKLLSFFHYLKQSTAVRIIYCYARDILNIDQSLPAILLLTFFSRLNVADVERWSSGVNESINKVNVDVFTVQCRKAIEIDNWCKESNYITSHSYISQLYLESKSLEDLYLQYHQP